MPRITGFDPLILLAPLRQAFKEANDVTGRRFQQEITSNKWAWPNPPSPRDIVDLRNLRDSYTPQVGETEWRHQWLVEHAIYAHEGWTTRSGFVGPPRRWTTAPRQDFPKVYVLLARRRFS